MTGGLEFDEETSRKVELLYLTPDVVTQRCQVLKALDLTEAERVLDIGSGPGLLAYDLAASVGPAGRPQSLPLCGGQTEHSLTGKIQSGSRTAKSGDRYKRTHWAPSSSVRFTPVSRHNAHGCRMSSFDPKPTS